MAKKMKKNQKIIVQKEEDMIRAKDLENEISYLEDSLEKVKLELERLRSMVPEGARLRVARHGDGFQYFIRSGGMETTGIYIKKEDEQKARILAQIEYDEKLEKILQKTLKGLKKGKAYWLDNPFVLATNKMIPGKRELVQMPYITDERYLSFWKEQEYEGLAFREGFSEYYTRQGLRVRSKSEVIIADVLDEMSVPFLYEKPIQLDTGTVYPDFTLLNMRRRKEIYWEHFGMMDDADYRNKAISKIRKYEANGLYQQDSVIWTFETGNYPLSTKDIRKMIAGLKEAYGY